jgi:hypothetical protein
MNKELKKLFSLMIIFLLLTPTFLNFAPQIVQAINAKFSDWSYQLPIYIINHNPYAILNYDAKIIVNTKKYILSGMMRTDCGDIRFSDEKGNSLSYWIQPNTCNTNETIIWVKVPYLPSNSTTMIYMLYGNPSATDESNGNEVFLFFDNFSGTSLNTKRWSTIFEPSSNAKINAQIHYPTFNVNNDLVVNVPDNCYYYVFIPNRTFSAPVIAEMYFRIINYSTTSNFITNTILTGTNSSAWYFGNFEEFGNYGYWSGSDWGLPVDTNWHLKTMIIENGNQTSYLDEQPIQWWGSISKTNPTGISIKFKTGDETWNHIAVEIKFFLIATFSQNIEISFATTTTPPPSIMLLDFNVYYGEQLFTVSVKVPPEKYNEIEQKVKDLYSQYPGVDPSTLKKAYYLYFHVLNPANYPILGISLLKNGQQVADKTMKTEVFAGLLLYCFELFPALSQHQLNVYQNYGDEWRKLYDDAKTRVIVSTKLTHYTYLATVVGPILDVILSGIGFSQAMEIKHTISLAFDLWTSSHDELAIKYGIEAANDIINILIKHKFLSSSDYDPSELYIEMMSNPSEALKALKEIEEEVFNIRLESDAENLINKFLFNLASELLIGYTREITSTALTSLILYYKNQLTEEISYQLVESMYADILKCVILLSLASAIEKSYNIPMADAIYSAWESEENISNIYYKMYNYGYEITHPQDTTLNLTKSKIWSGLAGLEYIYEYRYYDLEYYITHAEFLRGITNSSEWQSDLTWYSNAAQAALSHAEDWRNTLVNILALSQCDVESYDPGGVNFSLEFSPPPTSSPFPVVPENSSGFAVIANGTSSITLSSGNYKFIVVNRTWFSNFTYSLYVDDAYGNSYLIVFNPPQQQYSIEIRNETPVTLKNFALVNGEVRLSDAGKTTGKYILFNVVRSQVDPTSVQNISVTSSNIPGATASSATTAQTSSNIPATTASVTATTAQAPTSAYNYTGIMVVGVVLVVIIVAVLFMLRRGRK